jgi:hypothetical protein
MNILLAPKTWEKLTGIEVIDPDGWDRRPKMFDWAKPITLRLFIDKCAESTCRGYVDYQAAAQKASLNFATMI